MAKKKAGNRGTSKTARRAAKRKKDAKSRRRLVSGDLTADDLKALKQLAARAEFSENVERLDAARSFVIQEAMDNSEILDNGNVEITLPPSISIGLSSTMVLSNGLQLTYTVEMHGDKEVPHASLSKRGAVLKHKQVRRVLDALGFLPDATVSPNPGSGVWHAWNKSWVRPTDVDMEMLSALNPNREEAMWVAEHSCPVGQQFWQDMFDLGDGTVDWTVPSAQDRQRWMRQVLAAEMAPERPVLPWDGPPADEREIYVREVLEAQVSHLVCCPICMAAQEAVESGAMA